MPILHLIFAFLVSPSVWSYPEFIGYKYTSCLTCHFNGNGNGPLNDYGRALWSAEIANRAFFPSWTEDQLSESSGFLGKKQLPWWIRPGFKARDLYMVTNPRGAGSTNRNILMQADANVALFLDKDQKYTFVVSYGYVPTPIRISTSGSSEKVNNWISREHYFRYQATDSLWLYAGFLDKPFGIRIVDHTAYSRMYTGLAQNDQAHGVIAQYIQPKYELSVDGFAGNLYQRSDLRQQGGSVLFEYEPMVANRIGASFLSSSNNYLREQRIAIHDRTGLGYGSAILLEVGAIANSPKTGDATNGLYVYAEAQQKLFRGYHFFVVGQLYKDDLKAGHDNLVKTSFGLLAFPMARVEWRLQFDNGRAYNDATEVSPESWQFLAQLHVSL